MLYFLSNRWLKIIALNNLKFKHYKNQFVFGESYLVLISTKTIDKLTI